MNRATQSEWRKSLQEKLELGFIPNLPSEDPERNSGTTAKTISIKEIDTD
jgi:hypothetical protein